MFTFVKTLNWTKNTWVFNQLGLENQDAEIGQSSILISLSSK